MTPPHCRNSTVVRCHIRKGFFHLSKLNIQRCLFSHATCQKVIYRSIGVPQPLREKRNPKTSKERSGRGRLHPRSTAQMRLLSRSAAASGSAHLAIPPRTQFAKIRLSLSAIECQALRNVLHSQGKLKVNRDR